MIHFLHRNLKGYRCLIVVAIVMTVAQVGADLLVAFPLKFIVDKIVHHIDPSVPWLGGLLGWCDRFGTTDGLHHREVHTLLGVIIFSSALTVVLGVLSGLLTYTQLDRSA